MEMCDFFNPKNVNIGFGIDHTKNPHLLTHLSKTPLFQWEIISSHSKRWRFFVSINVRANGNIFRVKKSHSSLRSVFLDHSVLGFSVQSNVTD